MNPDDEVVVADCDLRVIALNRSAARALSHQPRLWIGDIDCRSSRATRASAGTTFITQPHRTGPLVELTGGDLLARVSEGLLVLLQRTLRLVADRTCRRPANALNTGDPLLLTLNPYLVEVNRIRPCRCPPQTRLACLNFGEVFLNPFAIDSSFLGVGLVLAGEF